MVTITIHQKTFSLSNLSRIQVPARVAPSIPVRATPEPVRAVPEPVEPVNVEPAVPAPQFLPNRNSINLLQNNQFTAFDAQFGESFFG